MIGFSEALSSRAYVLGLRLRLQLNLANANGSRYSVPHPIVTSEVTSETLALLWDFLENPSCQRL